MLLVTQVCQKPSALYKIHSALEGLVARLNDATYMDAPQDAIAH